MAALFSMCCCHGWLGTSLLPFWDKNKPPSLPFLFSSLSFPRLLSSCPISPLILRDKDRQRPTRECPPSPLPAPAQIKTQTLPQERRRRGRQRDGVKKAREEWQGSGGWGRRVRERMRERKKEGNREELAGE